MSAELQHSLMGDPERGSGYTTMTDFPSRHAGTPSHATSRTLTSLATLSLVLGVTGVVLGAIALHKADDSTPTPAPAPVYPPGQQGFTTAPSLEALRAAGTPSSRRAGPAPDSFEWVNPAEVVAGSQTCGFLNPRLGSAPDEPYPTVRTYFCMNFSSIQPAPKGNLFTHCGGPGSLSDCPMGGVLSQGNLDNYNIITVDQRGLGRSSPNFAHAECTYGVTDGKQTQTENAMMVDVRSEADVMAFQNRQIARVKSCWEVPEFTLKPTDGSNQTYHFLDFSGTQALIEDINRFRIAMGISVLSFWGVSYGTQVSAAYASAFPSAVDKFIIDSNVTPLPDLYTMGLEVAANKNLMVDFAVYKCDAANAITPGACTDDAPRCIKWIFETTQEFVKSPQGWCCNPDALLSTLVAWASDPRTQKNLAIVCQYAQLNNTQDLRRHFANQCDCPVTPTRRAAVSCTGAACASKPTSQCNVYGNPNYSIMMGCPQQNPDFAAIPQTLIMAQSFTGACYNKDLLWQQLSEVNRLYSGLDTYVPGKSFLYWYGMGLFWPKSNPLAPASNPIQRGIVAGVMFDPNTPYLWTQKQKQVFPMCTLITSQHIGHGLHTATSKGSFKGAVPCLRVVDNYLSKGSVEITDGFTCRAPLNTPGGI